MKNWYLYIVFVFFLSCNNESETQKAIDNEEGVILKDTLDVPKMVFGKPSFDFGKVKEGEMVTYTFQFKNEGTKPLIISNAYASCGCTVPKWPKEPIAPGGTGEIYVEFNTTGKKGVQSKKVNIKANTVPEENFVELNGVVE